MKRQVINVSKQKPSIDKLKSKTVLINSFGNSMIESLPIPIQVSALNTKEIDIIIIGSDTYCTASKLKKTQIFAVLIKNQEYQIDNEDRLKTDPRFVVSMKHHNFLDIFSQKNLNILLLYQKYDYKIILET